MYGHFMMHGQKNIKSEEMFTVWCEDLLRPHPREMTIS